MHCRLYMKASVLENLELLVHTTYVMVFGLVAVQVDMKQEDAFIAPHWQARTVTSVELPPGAHRLHLVVPLHAEHFRESLAPAIGAGHSSDRPLLSQGHLKT